jgi:small subunit ribosomal protein S2
MKRFIMTERNGIYIIDLQQSLTYINNAYDFVKETVAHGGSILFVGTKKQAQEPIAEQATRVGMPYVNHRWLGGIRGMAKVPSAVWIVDTKKEHLAVDEARKLGLPVIAILDTNCDPDEVDYKIPGNDDAIRSVTLLTRVIADAVAEGLISRSGGNAAADAEGAADEPLPEWERELLGGDAEATAEAVAPAAGETAAADAADAAPAEAVAPVEAAAETTEAPAAEAPVEAAAETTEAAPVDAEAAPAEQA